jgi:hypothetical protein
VRRIALIWKVGVVKTKPVGINSGFVLNVIVTTSFVGNLMLKQPITITLWQKVFKQQMINQMIRLFLARENGIKHNKNNKMITLTLQKITKILMCVLAFGEMNKVN